MTDVRKVAIFVEGMTEQEFVVGLVSALVGNRGIQFALGRQWKGQVQISASSPTGPLDFYVLIVDCCSDGQVKTQMRDRYRHLIAVGYTAILGLRDVYPHSRVEIPMIESHLSKGLPTGAVTPKIHLAVMEVEAWFIGETTHFSRLHTSLTIPFILGNGFDLANQSADQWSHPADVLDNIYKLAKMRYVETDGRKSKRRVQRTLRALSFDELYVNVRQQLPAFNDFITDIEAALF